MEYDFCLRVAPSPVHGLGVFAVKPIKKGTRILEYEGKIVSLKQVMKEIAQGKRDPYSGHTFLMVLNDRALIDGEQGGNESRMINHSCSPNVMFAQRMLGARPEVIALRNVQKGEELFLDYNLEIVDDVPDAKHVATLKCLCKAAKCRGSMLSKAQLSTCP